MDKALLEWVILDIHNESTAIDPHPKHYLLDKKYAKHRSEIVLLGPVPCRSRLSILLREAMTEDRRKKVFDRPYDLGNMRPLSPELCTYEELANELYGKGRNGKAANDAFETIQHGIYCITGKKLQEHFKINKSTALKVVKTLDVLSRHRQSRLMQLLKLPESDQKFSMSFRDAYPYEKNEEQVWLIADLKAYLSTELSEKRFQEISITFSSLTDLINNFIENVEKILIGAYCPHSDYAPVISAYAALTPVVKDFQFNHEPKDVPLDEELFIHLHVLEFAHFAIGYRQLIDVAIPRYQIIPVFRELRALTENAFSDDTLSVVKESDPLLSIREVQAFALRSQKEIVAIIEKAMGMSMTQGEYDRVITHIPNLLRNFYWFQADAGYVPYDDAKQISPWHTIAAACCVWHSLKSPTNFKPYWLGQPSQGGSVNSSIKEAVPKVDVVRDNVPEEHRHIWTYRLEWFADALRGHAELREQRFAFRSTLIIKVLDICRTNNTDSIVRELTSFGNYIKSHTLRHQYVD